MVIPYPVWTRIRASTKFQNRLRGAGISSDTILNASTQAAAEDGEPQGEAGHLGLDRHRPQALLEPCPHLFPGNDGRPEFFDHEAPGKGLPRAPIDLPALPRMRRYIVPEQSHVLLNRDYSQQELRILAHYEDGFALARVPPPDAVVHHDSRTMDVLYVAEPGPRLALGEISVSGLERLHEDYVRRRYARRHD